MQIKLNVTTADGELLEVIEVQVEDDLMYPVGRGMARAAILAEIESAALVVVHRSRKAASIGLSDFLDAATPTP